MAAVVILHRISATISAMHRGLSWCSIRKSCPDIDVAVITPVELPMYKKRSYLHHIISYGHTTSRHFLRSSYITSFPKVLHLSVPHPSVIHSAIAPQHRYPPRNKGRCKCMYVGWSRLVRSCIRNTGSTSTYADLL